MKIISLNCYFGNVFEPLMDFLTREAPTTDVFCLQEVVSNPKEDAHFSGRQGRANLLQELVRRLPGFDYHFAPMQYDFDTTPDYPQQTTLGVVIFFKKTLPVSEHGDFMIYNSLNSYHGQKDWETLGHTAVYVCVDGTTPLTIITLHGNSQPADKRDSPKRLEQSQKILNFLAPRDGEKIVIGDFNLYPDTESIRLFEKAGFRNLITEHGITSTRGSHMHVLFPEYENGPYGFQEFADYAFTSPGINVDAFTVPDAPVSDHLPMILDCTYEKTRKVDDNVGPFC